MKLVHKLIFISQFILSATLYGQSDSIKIAEITRAEILKMTDEELLAIPFSELIIIANKLGITIDELLKMKTSVASKTELTPRETPGIVSIVTQQEIKQLGARDLLEVLRTVPGINFAYDDGSIIGMNMRGNWGHEGKILLIIDGQEFNELKYNTLQFGRHFDVDQIKKIEVIRGPGSSIYGGNAELGVINITTFNGEDINGMKLHAGYNQMGSYMGFGTIGLSAGKKIEDWDISLQGNINKGIKSDKKYFYFKEFDLSQEGANTSSQNINLGVTKQNLGIRIIYDLYNSAFIYGTNQSDVKSYEYSFLSYLGEIKYDFKAGDKLFITPKINYKLNKPYYKDYDWVTNNTAMSRYTGNVTIKYLPTKKIDIIGGVEYLHDNGKMVSDNINAIFENGRKKITYNTISSFLQGIIKTKPINFIVGGRFDNHNEFGPAFAPRVGLTKMWGKYHFKMLYSGAFRSPSIGNLLKSTDIEPEKTTVAEIELGYKINENMFLTANVFNIDIKDPIIWSRIADSGYYENSKQTGSMGFELEYRIKYTLGYAIVNYSYYGINKNTVDDYSITNHSSLYKGSPSHKATFQGSIGVTRKINIAPSIIFMSKQYGNPMTTYSNEIDPSVICNLFLHYRNLFIRKLELSVGVTDIFNQSPVFLQAYNGNQVYFPSASREFCFKLNYAFDWVD